MMRLIRNPRLWSLRGDRTARDTPAPAALSASAQATPARVAAVSDGQSALPPFPLTEPVMPDGRGHAPAADDGTPYLAHFGLSTRPFSLLPDPDFLFWSPIHKRAHAVLEYGLMSRAPLTMVTGDIGAGKTTLVHQLLRGLGKDVRVGLISNASDLRGELLYWVLTALGESPARGGDPAATFETFQSCLVDTYAKGRRVVLIFDEAQTLGRDRLEELRMLTNINTGSDVLLQIMLVGQPELRDTVRRPDMEQFTQRVAASFHLPAMEAETQKRYIHHRLQVAGACRPIFEEAALGRIHGATGGVPRRTNQICDLAMLYAYSAHKPVVDAACVQHVLDDGVLLGTGPATEGRPEGGPTPQPGLTSVGPARQ